MTVEITYTQARDTLARLLDKVTENREIVIIRRRGGEDAALISADELASLVESAYLLRSPANAQRLLEALGRALKDEGPMMAIDTPSENQNPETAGAATQPPGVAAQRNPMS